MSQVAETQGTLSHPDALYEVVDGRIEEKAEKGSLSTHVAGRLFAEVFLFVKTQRLGRVETEMLYVLDSSRPLKRRPDLSFVSYDRWPAKQPMPEGEWEVVPDLAVEVTSPNDLDWDIQRKVREYLKAGVRQVWLVRPPEESVSVYRSVEDIKVFTSSAVLDGGEVLPGFRMALAELFRTTDE